MIYAKAINAETGAVTALTPKVGVGTVVLSVAEENADEELVNEYVMTIAEAKELIVGLQWAIDKEQ